MYSHCIFPLTNLKTLSAVPVAAVFESPSRCCRALQYALQYRFICKDQNNEKNVNSQTLRYLFHYFFFVSNWEPFFEELVFGRGLYSERLVCIGRDVCVSKPAKLILAGK